MPKSYLMVFYDWPEKTAFLPDDAKGRLIEALVRYARGEDDVIKQLKPPEYYIFPTFVSEIRRADAKYEEVSQKRKAAGKKSRQNKSKQTEANASKTEQNEAKSANTSKS